MLSAHLPPNPPIRQVISFISSNSLLRFLYDAQPLHLSDYLRSLMPAASYHLAKSC